MSSSQNTGKRCMQREKHGLRSVWWRPVLLKLWLLWNESPAMASAHSVGCVGIDFGSFLEDKASFPFRVIKAAAKRSFKFFGNRIRSFWTFGRSRVDIFVCEGNITILNLFQLLSIMASVTWWYFRSVQRWHPRTSLHRILTDSRFERVLRANSA